MSATPSTTNNTSSPLLEELLSFSSLFQGNSQEQFETFVRDLASKHLVQPDDSTEDDVTPFRAVTSSEKGFDYERLIHKFGSTKITPELLARIERLTGQPCHPLLARGFFFSHREFEKILDLYESGKPFFLYTGRGPSSGALHLGHLVPFMFAKYLQDCFNVPLVIQLTDDEKFLHKDLTLEEAKQYTRANAKDIIALGFDVNKTFIFANTQYIGHLYSTALNISKHVTANQIRGIFGVTGGDNMGKHFFPAIQAAPCFASCFPETFGGRTNVACLIPCAIDQDPYFRMTRDVAPRLGLPKPALIHSKFLPGLRGLNRKMSSSDPTDAIFVTDSPDEIQTKINRYALSGGRDTAELQRQFGANLQVDVAYHFLTFFLDSQERLDEIGSQYKSGKLLTGQVKKELISLLVDITGRHQRARAEISEELVDKFMTPRCLLQQQIQQQ